LSLRLRIRAGSQLGAAASIERVFEITPDSGDLVIGRRRGSDIELPFVVISEQQARLSRSGRGWSVMDLGSANGTSLNGQRLTPLVAQALAAGDVLRLANVELLFGDGEKLGKEDHLESTATLARRLVSDFFGAQRPGEVARLVVLSGPAAGHELRLDEMDYHYRIGRGAGCNLVVPDDDMSREHAELERRWDGVFLRDLRSKNGVMVMGERVVGERRLSDGDLVVLGQTSLRLQDPEDRYLRQMEEAEAVQAGTAAQVEQAAITNTRTSSRAAGAWRTGQSTPMAVVGRNSDALLQADPSRSGQAPSRRGPQVLVVVAALVLVGAIALAVSFLFGN
jgi:pSer/pThr/pTyr-binding forkhead associated (FHA) protein